MLLKRVHICIYTCYASFVYVICYVTLKFILCNEKLSDQLRFENMQYCLKLQTCSEFWSMYFTMTLHLYMYIISLDTARVL